MFNNALLMPVKLNGDDYFHLSRIYNLSGDPFQFLYPQNFISGGRIGAATNIFYPSVNMQLIVNILPKFNGVISLYRVFLVTDLFIICSSFYALLRFKLKVSKTIAISISIIWSSFVITHPFIDNFAADGLAKVAIPFIVYGLLHISDRSGYRWLYVGLVIALFCHILSALLLVIFIGLYYIVSLFIEKNGRKIATENICKAALATFFTGMVVIYPLISFMTSNKVSAPAQPGDCFVTWTRDTEVLLQTPTYFLLIATIIACFILTKKIYYGQILSILMALLGTSFVAWPYYLRSSPLSVMQFPFRFLDFSLFVCLAFSFILVSQMSFNQMSKKFWIISSIVLCATLSTKIHGFMFPPIQSDGSAKIASVESVEESYQKHEDGYHISEMGGFNNHNTRTDSFWNMINYADYVPNNVKANPQTQFLMMDSKASSLASHEIVIGNSDRISTKDFVAKRKTISFKSSKKITADVIKLPVVGYHHANIKVYLNGRKINYQILDGQITIKGSISSEDVITIKQVIPISSLFSFFVSIVSIIVMLFITFGKRYFGKKMSRRH